MARPMPLPEKIPHFWGRTKRDLDTGCLEWVGARSTGGYGQVKVAGRCLYAHRIAWAFTTGEDPGPMDVLHHCDNPPCVEPRHLFLGTAVDNAADMVAKGRGYRQERAAYCRRGHPRYGANLYVSPRGARCCRRCVAINARAYRDRKR